MQRGMRNRLRRRPGGRTHLHICNCSRSIYRVAARDTAVGADVVIPASPPASLITAIGAAKPSLKVVNEACSCFARGLAGIVRRDACDHPFAELRARLLSESCQRAGVADADIEATSTARRASENVEHRYDGEPADVSAHVAHSRLAAITRGCLDGDVSMRFCLGWAVEFRRHHLVRMDRPNRRHAPPMRAACIASPKQSPSKVPARRYRGSRLRR